MIQLINSRSLTRTDTANKLKILVNPTHLDHLKLLLHTRIFLFEESGGSLYIDFTEYPILANCMYIIPPLHFHHLNHSNNGNFVCVDIDNGLLKSHHKKLLFAIKYTKQKSLPVLTIQGDNCTFSNLASLQPYRDKEHHVVSVINTWIMNRIPSEMLYPKTIEGFKHIELADQFLGLLMQKTLTHDICQVNNFASEMYCTERTLHRICKAAFGICAKDILAYHLILNAICLLGEYEQSISNVAAELRFSSIAVFDRYIRRGTGLTPSQIRAKLQDAGV